MSKFRLNNPNNTPLDPFAFEKSMGVKPDTYNPYPVSGVADSLEFVTSDRIEEGYGTLGNSSYAVQAINEAKAYNQGALELTAKGLGNVVKTIGIEIGKIPGYLGGAVGAIANETIGDGKNSMSMIVDNAWINAFEGLDEEIKSAMPVYISQQVQEGNLLDKLGSGEWWATSGADGLGFMLSMFAPGAIAKGLGVGAKIASVGEALGNMAPRLGKIGTGLKLLEKLPSGAFKYTEKFARNAGGHASALLNTTIESSAEAANTFDNLKSQYLTDGLSEEEASQKAGEGASAVFKGNMALLFVSNYLDEMFIWKSIGSAGSKEAAKSLMGRAFKDGVIDMDVLKQIPKEFTRASVLKRTATNFGKGVVKEGFFEEGSQTTLQQNIEKGMNKNFFLENLYDVGATYLDDFSNNTELHEAIFLGGLLGGGASIIGTVQENNALRAAYSGGTGRTKSNSIFAKYGLLPETKDQKGFAKILGENHIQQFRSYKDFLTTNENGKFVLDEQKLVDAQIGQTDNFRANILYDLSVEQGSKLGQEIFGQYLAANYVKGFLGQEGSKELFQEHVQNQVLPAWQKRFTETFGRDATSKEAQDYVRKFKQSGERVIDAYTQAEETNYPERYFQEKTKEYQDFKGTYFHNKFQNLVTLDSIKQRKSEIQNDLLEAGVLQTELEELDTITDPIKKQKAEQIKKDLEELEKAEKESSNNYTKFFTEAGVKEMFEAFKERKAQFEQASEEILQENEELREKVDAIPDRNKTEVERLQQLAAEQGYPDLNVPLKGVNGETFNLQDLDKFKGDLSDKRLEIDDISKAEWDSFTDTGEASASVLERIVEKVTNNKPLSVREQAIFSFQGSKIEELLKAEAAKLGEQLTPIQSTAQEDTNYNEVDKSVEEVNKKKGVNLYPSTGRNIQNELTEIKEGLYAEKLTDSPSQKLWFETLDEEVSQNPTAYAVQVIRKDDKSNLDLWNQIDRDAEPTNTSPNDLYTVLLKNGKPVIKAGNYVFTGLWRPDSLYPTKNGTPFKFILAEQTILDNFLLFVKLPNLNMDKLSKNQIETLKQAGVLNEVTEQSIKTAAFFHAKEEYTKWYNDLADNPRQLEVAGITKGHAVKLYSNETAETPVWNKPLNGIKGLKLAGNKLVGGKFVVSTTGVVQAGTESYTIPTGDLVVIDDRQNLHPMKARNINEDEMRTVLYLLSLRSQPGPTEAIKVSAPKNIQIGNKSTKSIPIFYNDSSGGKGSTRANLIESLISFGFKSGGKGEIYWNQQSLRDDPLLVWTNFDGVTQNIAVSKIKNAIDTNDFTEIQPLVDFLNQKRFNINEQFLGNGQTSTNFSKPNVVYKVDETGKKVPELEWSQDRTYFDHLLNDVLTTTTQQLDGYPDRVQRNLFFNKNANEDLSEFQNIDDETVNDVEILDAIRTDSVSFLEKVTSIVEPPVSTKDLFIPPVISNNVTKILDEVKSLVQVYRDGQESFEARQTIARLTEIIGSEQAAIDLLSNGKTIEEITPYIKSNLGLMDSQTGNDVRTVSKEVEVEKENKPSQPKVEQVVPVSTPAITPVAEAPITALVIADIERRRQEDLELVENVGEDKLKEGRKTTIKLLESLKQRYSATSLKGIIIRLLEKLVDFNKYSTVINSDYVNKRNASGQATWFGMILSQETVDGILSGKEYDVHTFIHEIIHGFTTSKLSDYNITKKGLIPNWQTKLTEKETKAIEQLERIFNKVRQALPKNKDYGLTNLDEFVAEAFSNESFQATLKDIKSENKKSNLFKEYILAIGDLLYEQLEKWAKRFNKELPRRENITSILEDVFAWTEDLVDQNNKLAYIGTVDETNAKYDAELAKLTSAPIETPKVDVKVSKKEEILNKIKNRPKTNLDDYADKILTTEDLLKQKIQDGEIIKKCK